MAHNAEWEAFCGLLDIDGAKTDLRGELARTVKASLGQYMDVVFGTTDVTALVNIINSPAVVAAVVTSLQHVADDDVAIKAAVAAAAAEA